MKKRQCPECGQNHFKRAQIIYESGTRTGHSSGPNYNVSYHNQTSMAERHSPPFFAHKKPPSPIKSMLMLTYIIIMIGLCAPASIYIPHWNEALNYFHSSQNLAYLLKYWHIFALVLGFFIFTYIYLFKRYARHIESYRTAIDQHNQSYEGWQNTWVCMDCGHKIISKF